MVLAGAGFYFFVMRPQKAKQRAAREALMNVQPGQEIMTTAGLYGTVVSTTDEDFVLEIAPGINVRYIKAAIAKVVVPEEPEADEAKADDAPAADAPAEGVQLTKKDEPTA